MTKITKKEAYKLIKDHSLKEHFIEGNMCIGEKNMKKWTKPFSDVTIWQKGKNHHFYVVYSN